MSELRKANTDATYFLTFTVVGWIDLLKYRSGLGTSIAIGRFIAGAGVAYSTYQAFDQRSVGNGVDAVFGTLSLIPATSLVGTVYFGADLMTLGITGRGISEHIDDYYWIPITTGTGPSFIPIPKNY